jgi:alpha-mannosidase
VDREINFVFTGCYTTQSRIKMGNRHGEAALLDAEALDAMGKALTGKRYPSEKLEHAWRKLLFNHFHDIITGSCVRDSRDYAMANYSEVQAVAGTAREKAGLSLAGEIDTSMIPAGPEAGSGTGPEAGPGTGSERGTRSEGAGAGYGLDAFSGTPSPGRGRGAVRVYHVFNSSAHKRREAVEFTLWDWDHSLDRAELSDYSGKALPFQLLDREPVTYWDHRYVRFIAQVEVPAGGYTTVVLREKEYARVSLLNSRDPRLEAPLGPLVLENGFLRAEFDPASGALRSLRDKKTGREKIAAGGSAGLVLTWSEKGSNDAWHIGRRVGQEPVSRPLRISPFGGKDSLRQGFELEQEVLRSRVKTSIFLDRDARAVAYRFNVVWNEAAEDYPQVPVLCFSVPLDAEPDAYQSDVPAGVQRRPGSFQDVPGLQYTAAVKDGEALALVTDSKYGYRGCEGLLSATLINTASSPDPYPERGEHAIKLWVALEAAEPKTLSEAAEDLCRGMCVISGNRHPGKLPPAQELLRLDAASTVLSSTGLTAEGALLVRVYETAGKKDSLTLTAPSAIRSAELVDLDGKVLRALEPRGRAVSFEIAPWKIGAVKMVLA